MEKQYRRCLVILLDGLTPELLDELIALGKVERIPEILPHGSTAVSAFPSTTGPAYTPPLTGLFPGHAGLPGIRWFDRREYGSRIFSARRFRSYVGLGAYRMNGDMAPEARTVFEYFERPYNIFSSICRGVSPSRNADFIRRAQYVVHFYALGDCGPFDRGGRRALLRGINSDADFIFFAPLSIDEYSHHLGPDHPKITETILWLDRAVGQAADLLRRRGELDDTLIILLSDHGNTPTSRHLDLDALIESMGLKNLYYPSIWRHWVGAEAASMVSGNAMSNVYLKGPKGWETPLHYGDLEGKYARLVEELRGCEALDVIFVREGEERARILGPSGESRVSAAPDGRISYEVLAGADPLGYGQSFGPVTTDEALALTYETRYPDGPVQILQHFRTHRAGDLAVCAKEGWDLRREDYELHRHHSSHGALYRSHMMVPFRSNHPIARRHLRTADVFPTAIRLCGRGEPPPTDGRDFTAPADV